MYSCGILGICMGRRHFFSTFVFVHGVESGCDVQTWKKVICNHWELLTSRTFKIGVIGLILVSVDACVPLLSAEPLSLLAPTY